MEIFNIGFPELILILLLMLIVLGPDQTVTHAKSLARFIRKLVRSPLWADIMNTSREIKSLPTKMLRETGIEDEMKEINNHIRPAVIASSQKMETIDPSRVSAQETENKGALSSPGSEGTPPPP